MVECMTAENFKPLIISVLDSALSNVANISHPHDFVSHIQCVRKVAVHLGYGRLQFKYDGTR
jgi:hypothetical protein